ncbi:MAG TPA: HAMP domain-containing sensor histidine kinase [Bacteriovoracaceae bacterium]|nr:HAMP domain-containing sensor histidine kinase [Bacteriovoracaceae bacterium]
MIKMGQLMELVREIKSAPLSPGEMLASYRELERQLAERTSELNRVSNENAQIFHELKAAVKMREEFLSIASHELRTPITALHLSLQLLERNVSRDGDKVDLKRVHSLAKNSIELSRRVFTLQEVLMDLTKISRGHLGLNLSESELCGLTREAITQFQVLSKDVNISVHAKEPIPGKFDPVRISQVIINLVSNAVKYGARSPISISLESNKGRARVEVADRGPGIPSELVSKIFDRFARSSSDACQAGLGLGLYISRQIVEAHGGTLNVHSAAWQGTTFIAEFPV